MLFVADVLNLVVSAGGRDVAGEVASAGLVDGEIRDLLLDGDLTAGLVAASLWVFECRFVSRRAIFGVGDLTPRLIGGGVALSELSEVSELAVTRDDRVVSRSSLTVAAASGLELISNGAGVAEDCAGAGESLSSSFRGADASTG